MLDSFLMGASEFNAKGDAARDRRDWPTASKFYRKALDTDRDQPAIWVQLGHALKESGDIQGAEGAYREALRIQPDSSDAHLQLGHALKLLGRRENSMEAYAKAVALDPANKHARAELAALGYSPASANRLLPRTSLARATDAARRQGYEKGACCWTLDGSELKVSGDGFELRGRWVGALMTATITRPGGAPVRCRYEVAALRSFTQYQ